MRKNMEKIYVKRKNRIGIAKLMYNPIFSSENKKIILQVKMSLFSHLTVLEMIRSKL